MPLTKAQLVKGIQNRLDLPKDKSSEAVDAVIEIIKTSLESGDDVLVSGFGKFHVRHKAERKGRNPATGEDLILESRKVVTFKCSGKLKDRINR